MLSEISDIRDVSDLLLPVVVVPRSVPLPLLGLVDLGVFCFVWGYGVFIENLFFFYSGQILEMYVVLHCIFHQEYSDFTCVINVESESHSVSVAST